MHEQRAVTATHERADADFSFARVEHDHAWRRVSLQPPDHSDSELGESRCDPGSVSWSG